MEVTLENSMEESCGDIDVEPASTRFPRRQTTKLKKFCAKEERNASIKRVSLILQKSENLRTTEEAQMLSQCSEAVEEVQLRWKKRNEAKRRLEEFEEPQQTLQEKCQILAQAIAQSQHLVVYTGAGISTAARIPDYRGPNGIWTRLQQGKEIGNHDLSLAEPTFTHMALSKLYHSNILKYVVSQNCDGLHLRSGLPRNALSELHGNMYVEVCKSCKPAKEYWRMFDVTENTARYAHKTMRRCYVCNEPLVDTIVHFGERGILQWPLNWSGASKNAQKATTILCLGSSLKVLKRYPWLWQMDKPAKKRPNLYIVNLQWTPKDDCANVKIHGKCDEVMKIVMNSLGMSVPDYDRFKDPIFYHATPLYDEELHTTNQPALKSADEDMGSVQSANCDNACNIRRNLVENVPVKFNQKPLKEQHFNKCSFSIDSILERDSIETENIKGIYNDVDMSSHFGLLFPQNYHALVAYYRFTEAIILQNPLLSYQDMFYYPYQTSFLYSGLHSIINNPFPLSTANLNIKSEPNDTRVFDCKHSKNGDSFKKPAPELFACHFCNTEFKTVSCLFYVKSNTLKQETFKKTPCFCCDYSTDEDDDSVKKEKSSDTERDEGEVDKDQTKIKIQAGWFGKGYRKIKRPRKR
ncbi:hypothetical protein PPYR_10484 [Photinus pyralis]|uniref:protein acetyllysine N-acetyltransferase n=1 Tax=Photinus pyralis TaxID=7054 RepID=A0A1Y1MB62_PHOPY|nr:NAD-dependent protein deacetylase sirtuin-7 [Photinus pyralis]KAB0796423.1 hypothetical protein PPYR_10484 [Photinus pyralis]